MQPRSTAPNQGEPIDSGLSIDGDSTDEDGGAREDLAEDNGVGGGDDVGGGDGGGGGGSGGGGSGGGGGGVRLIEAVVVVVLAMLSLMAFHTPIGSQTLPTFEQAPARPPPATVDGTISRPTETTGGEKGVQKPKTRSIGPGLGLRSSDVGDLKRALTLMNKRGRSLKDVGAALEVFRTTEATAAQYCKSEGDGCVSDEERMGHLGLRLAVADAINANLRSVQQNFSQNESTG